MRTGILFLTLLTVVSCEKKVAPPKAQAPEAHTESATNWTTKSELFMEHPPLIAAGSQDRTRTESCSLGKAAPNLSIAVVKRLSS